MAGTNTLWECEWHENNEDHVVGVGTCVESDGSCERKALSGIVSGAWKFIWRSNFEYNITGVCKLLKKKIDQKCGNWAVGWF